MPSDIDGPPHASEGREPPTPTPPPLPAPGDATPERQPEPASVSSTSGDDLTLSLSQAHPDPLLGSFHDQEPPAFLQGGPVEPAATDATRADALADLGGLASDPDVVAMGPTSSEALASLGLSAHAPPSHSARPVAPPATDDGEDDDEPARGSSLAMMLLASYASAVTLGLIWVLMTGRGLRDRPPADFLPPEDAREDPGRRAERSRKVQAPEPLKAASVTTLGQPIQLGLIEVTPVAVTQGRVVLMRDLGKKETSQGGKGALFLTLRFKNTSDDTVVAPLDEAFIRERPGADPDSFIETGGAGPNVGMYPLALESEWTIANQVFRDLRPGESFETQVVSAPNALADNPRELTWRLRVRTNINHTEDMAVRFPATAVSPAR